MSIFCPNCGVSNTDDSKFCMSCGTPLAPPKPVTQEPVYTEPQPAAPKTYGDEYQQPVAGQGYGDAYQQPADSYGYQQNAYPYAPPAQQASYPAPIEKPKKKGKAAVIVVSLIALLLVAATVMIVVLPLAAHIDVFGLHLFDNSPKQVTERLLKAAYVDFNAKEVVNCLYETKYASGELEVKDSDVEQLQTILDTLKTNMESAKATLKYNILDEYYVEDDKYNEYIERMKKDGTDTSKIEKMLEVDFTLESMGSTSDTMTSLCIKAEGRWYVSAYTFTDSMSSL